MKIRDHFMELLELPAGVVMPEAKAKLSETVMRVNGHLKSIIDMDHQTLVLQGDGHEIEEYNGDDVTTLEFFLPNTGVYFIGKYPAMLWKLPKRQWKKSFSWKFYEASKPINIFLLREKERFEVYEYNRQIYYMEKVIGKKVPRKDEYVCTNSVFQLEFDRFISTLNG